MTIYYNTFFVTFPHCITIFKIRTDSEYIRLIFPRLYRVDVFWPGELIESVQLEIVFSTAQMTIEYNDKCQYVKSEYEAVVEIMKIIREKMIFEDPWCPFHGAALMLGERCILFLGESQSGKTTLAAFFSQKRDVRIISEDIVIVNCHTKEVAVVVLPLRLRESSYNLLTNEYYCDFNNLQTIWNGKKLVDVCFADKEVYILTDVFQLHRGGDAIRTEPSDEGGYITNGYCYTDIKRNIRCAITLNNILPAQKLYYSDLNSLYDYLCRTHPY